MTSTLTDVRPCVTRVWRDPSFWRRVLSGVLLLFVGGVLAATPASAHALLEQSSPSIGEVLARAPQQVEFDFSENVSLSLGYVRVVDTKGNRVDDGKTTNPGGDGSKVAIGLPSGLPDGGYIASYRVISADSHPVSGAISFAIGAGKAPSVDSAGTQTSTASSDPVVAVAYPVVRWLGYLGFSLLVGVIAFAGFVHPPLRRDKRLRRIGWLGFDIAIVSTVLGVLMQGVYGAGRGLGSLFDYSLIAATLETNLGRMYALRLVVLGFLGVLLWEWLSARVVARWLTYTATGLAVCMAATISGGGHASSQGFSPIMLGADMLHLLSVGVWIGGLVIVLAVVIPHTDDEDMPRVVGEFSNMALLSVIVIIVTGTFQALVEVGTFGALFGTTYGLLVVAKIVGLLIIVVIAYGSRSWVNNRVAAQTEDVPVPTRAKLRNRIIAEVVVAAAVIGVAAVLVSEPPAKDVYAAPANTTIAFSNGSTAQVTVDPDRSGQNAMHIYVFDKDGVIQNVPQVTVTIEQKAAKVGPLEVPLTKAGAGHFLTSRQNFPLKGDWTITITLNLSEFDQYVANTVVEVK